MQTKPSLVKIAGMVGVALAILALLLSAKILHRAHSSQIVVANPGEGAANPAVQLSSARKADWTHQCGQLPLGFEANQGQAAPEVRYLAHGQGYQLFLTGQEAVLTLRQASSGGSKTVKGTHLLGAHHKPIVAAKTSVLRMHLDGANPAPEIVGTKLLPGRVNYFIGNDPQKWHTDIPSYEAVRYREVYPGVDLLFYGREQRLEYDFVVAPGADPNTIALSIAGARKLEVSSQGDLVMSIAGGNVTLQKPVIYQEVRGERREIAGNYSIVNDRQIRFSLAAYDHTQPLTIDPVLNYSTYIGGEFFDFALGIALDAAGDAYIAGETQSTMFPQVNAVSTPPADVSLGTAFVSELNPGGTALLYSTYLGGSGNGSFGEGAYALAVDTASPPNIYVTGFTGSPDFPVSTVLLPYQGQPGPPSTALANGGAGFITKLAPSATGAAQLAYSSYLGGDTFDEGLGIAVDGSGNAFIAGETISTDFPTKGTPITAGLKSAAGNAFLTVINTTASGSSSLTYSTYLGGSSAGTMALQGFADIGYAITIDASDDAFVIGGTSSTDFPTAGTAIVGSAACGANSSASAFISVINTTAQTLTYSHCLSGNNYDIAFGINLGTGVPPVATKVAYITGTTASSNFPVTANSIPPAGSVAQGVAFVSLLNTATGALQYSTFLGGTGSDTGYSIASDSTGNAYVTGQTASTNFPVTQGALQLQNNNISMNGRYGTAFVSKISPNGQGLADLVYSTYFGGQTPSNSLTFSDSGQGIAVSGTNAYVGGYMTAPNMLTSTGAFQTALGAAGATNAFVADLPLTPTISVSPTSIPFGIQLVATPSQPQYVTITNNTANPIGLTLPPTSTNPDFVGTASGLTPCMTPLAGGASCTIGVIFTPAVGGAVSGTLNIVDALDGPTHPMQVALTGTGSANAPNITFSPTSLTLPGALLTTTSGPSPVSIGNNGNLPLSISAISAGTGVFTESSSTCNNGNFPIVIAPGGAACMVQVSFSPSATTTPGPVAGALTITQTGGNVSNVPLNGTAWDFSVTAVSSVTVPSGMSGMFAVTVTGLGGFTGPVAFTCTPGSALITSCAVPNINAAPAPGTTANGNLMAASFAVPPQSLKVPPSALLRQVILIMLAMALLFMIPSVQRFRTRMGMAGAILVFVLVAGCSGGPPAPKTSSVMITPSSGGVTKAAITVNVSITQ